MGAVLVDLFERLEDVALFDFMQCHRALRIGILHCPKIEMLPIDLFFIKIKHDDAFDEIAKLAHIAWPGIIEEFLCSRFGEHLDWFMVFSAKAREKVACEREDVFLALS